MQLGTRWSAGAIPPVSVPAEIRDAIAAIESEQGATGTWTLTFLEGRPIAELDTGFEVIVDAAGNVIARSWQD